MALETYYTVHQVAKILQIRPQSARELIKRRGIGKRVAKKYYVSEPNLRKLLEEGDNDEIIQKIDTD